MNSLSRAFCVTIAAAIGGHASQLAPIIKSPDAAESDQTDIEHAEDAAESDQTDIEHAEFQHLKWAVWPGVIMENPGKDQTPGPGQHYAQPSSGFLGIRSSIQLARRPVQLLIGLGVVLVITLFFWWLLSGSSDTADTTGSVVDTATNYPAKVIGNTIETATDTTTDIHVKGDTTDTTDWNVDVEVETKPITVKQEISPVYPAREVDDTIETGAYPITEPENIFTTEAVAAITDPDSPNPVWYQATY